MDTAAPAKGVVGCHSRGLGRVDPSDPIGKTKRVSADVLQRAQATTNKGQRWAAKFTLYNATFSVRSISFFRSVRAFRRPMCFITVPLRNRHTTMDGPHGQRPTPNRLTAQYRLQLAAGTREQDDHRRPACGNQNIRIARRRSRTLPRRPLRATSRCSSRSHVPLTTIDHHHAHNVPWT